MLAMAWQPTVYHQRSINGCKNILVILGKAAEWCPKWQCVESSSSCDYWLLQNCTDLWAKCQCAVHSWTYYSNVNRQWYVHITVMNILMWYFHYNNNVNYCNVKKEPMIIWDPTHTYDLPKGKCHYFEIFVTSHTTTFIFENYISVHGFP